MADQKSRGGQKTGAEGQGNAQDRHAHPKDPNDHSMKEDARRGQQGNQGGYHDDKPQSGKKDAGD